MKLTAQQQLEEEYHRFVQHKPRLLSEAEREAIRRLAIDIPALWAAASTSDADRKEIIRQVVDRLEKMNLSWVHPRHGGSFEQNAFPNYARALRENEFAYRGMLLGREIAKVAPM